MHVGQFVRILVGIAHQKIDQTPENRSYNRFGIFLVVRKIDSGIVSPKNRFENRSYLYLLGGGGSGAISIKASWIELSDGTMSLLV